MTDFGGSDGLRDGGYTPTIVDVQSYYVMARRSELPPQPQDLTPLSREFDRALEAEIAGRVAKALGRRMDSLGAELERAMKRLNDVGNVDTQYAQHNQLLRAVEVCAGAVRAFALAVEQEGESNE